MDTPTVFLDLREDLRHGREPFSKIMNSVAALGPEQKLRLLTPFEPVPLFHVLAKQGFRHTARAGANGEWEVVFEREGTVSDKPALALAQAAQPESKCAPTVPEIIEVDARGLEPPQPMVKILETLASFPNASGFRARTDRRPVHLYPQLEDRGYTAQTEEQPDGSYLTHIARH